MTDARLCRCPACNPIHGMKLGGMGRLKTRQLGREGACGVCAGSRRVTVSAAVAYLERLNWRHTAPTVHTYRKPSL